MPFSLRSILLGASLALGAPALADPALGTWLTAPDQKGQVAHVEVVPCGDALCGTIARAYDSGGTQIVTPNVGTKVFWDMRAEAQGRYKGRAYVPSHKRSYGATMTLAGTKLTVRGCLGPICQSQVWTRVR